MKKIIPFFALFICLSAFPNAGIKAAGNPAQENTQAQTSVALISRLQTIQKIDATQLGSDQKRKLVKEVKDIEKQLKTMDGGVYLSVGAIIIILLLLVLIL